MWASRFRLRGDFDRTAEVFAAAKIAEETHTEADSLKLVARVGPTDRHSSGTGEKVYSCCLFWRPNHFWQMLNRLPVRHETRGYVCAASIRNPWSPGLWQTTCNDGRNLVP